MLVYRSVMDNDNSGSSSGHIIENSEGTDLTQRDTLQFGEGFKAEDDSTNEKTVISPDVMQSGDMDDVITPLPSVAPKKEGIKYSTTEQVVGEWIDGKPVYQKTITGITGTGNSDVQHNISDIDTICNISGYVRWASGSVNMYAPIGFDNTTSYYFSAFVSETILYIRQKGYDAKNYIITIQYTKTTDTPNT